MLIVDRIEGEYIVVESDNGMINIKKAFVSPEVKEGNVIFENNGFYVIDKDETQRLRQKNIMLLRKIEGK